MNEAKRFMRYVLPGLAFVVELAIACWLSKVIEVPKELPANVGPWLGLTLGVLFSSGALGYIFSTIYFTVTPLIDYSNSLLTISRYCEHILILKPDRKMLPPSETKELTRRDKMIVVNQIWHWLRGHDKGMQAIEQYNERVSDTMHGVGATFVATLAALVVWGYMVCAYPTSVLLAWPIFAIWLALAVLLIVDYCLLRKYYTDFCNSSIITALGATAELDNGLRIILKGGMKHLVNST
jgi:hypothetical protein